MQFPTDAVGRELYTVGLRLGLAYRFGIQVNQTNPRLGFSLGGFLEPGAAILPNPTGPGVTAHPLLTSGATPGLEVTTPSFAFRLFLEIGGGMGWDTRSQSAFGFFHSGLNAAFEFR